MGHTMSYKKCQPTRDSCRHILRTMRSPVIFFIGKPRSGKSLQISRICKHYHFVHIDILSRIREEVALGTKYGSMFEDIVISEGTLIPRRVLFEYLRDTLCKNVFECCGYLIEGFPRTLQQALEFEEAVIVGFSMVIYVDIPDAIVDKRVKRDYTGTERDNWMEHCATMKRINTFDVRTKPILDYYKKKERLLIINGLKHPNKLMVDIKNAVDELFAKLGIHPPSRLE